ncbi:MAG: phage/plasmid primase, P4 family [Terriglobales bacterium]
MSNQEFNPPYIPRMAPQPLAKLFVEMYGDHFLSCYDRLVTMTYIADRVDTRWAQDVGNNPSNPRLCEKVAEFLACMVEIYNHPNEQGIKPPKFAGRQLYDFAYAADVARHVITMLDRVRYADKFCTEAHRDILGVARGQVLDTRTGELQTMCLDHYLDRRTSLVPDKDCPTPCFDEFLQRITLEDADLAAYLLRHGGYSLTGHTGEETLDFWLGEKAGNGKTTLANIFRRILRDGVYFTSLNVEALADSSANGDEMQMRTIGALVGVRLAIAMEGKRKVQLDQALFNRLTSKDPLRGKRLYENSFEFNPEHKLVIGSNYEPVLQIDGASKRRLHLVPFNARFLSKEEFSGAPGTFLKDGNFSQKLEAELPGVFHKLVLGCLEWRERGLDPPASVLSRTAEYWGKVDVVGAWEKEHKAEAEVFTETKALYKTFTQSMEGQGRVMPIEDFGEELRRRGYQAGQKTIDGRRPHGYYGLKP